MNKTLTIGISAMSGNLKSLLERLSLYLKGIDVGIDFLICVQGECDEIQFNHERVNIIYSESKGLSNSRNVILNENKSDLLWIQDDDIILNIDNVNTFYREISSNGFSIYIVKVESKEDRGNQYKNYSFFKSHKRLNALKISSIEIIVCNDLYKEHDIKFDTNLGLGTNFPCCEENLFLWQLFSTTTDVKYYNHYLCKHTTRIENRRIDFNGRYLAKGYFLSFLPFYYSFFIFIRWLSRDSCISFMSRLKSMISGYKFGLKS